LLAVLETNRDGGIKMTLNEREDLKKKIINTLLANSEVTTAIFAITLLKEIARDIENDALGMELQN
jgi:hypothetical protein